GMRWQGRRRAWQARRGVRGGSRREPVADAPDGLEVAGPRGLVLDLLAQPPDVDGDGARVEGRRVAPDPPHQMLTREHPPRMAGEEPEEVELACGETQRLAVLGHLPG